MKLRTPHVLKAAAALGCAVGLTTLTSAQAVLGDAGLHSGATPLPGSEPTNEAPMVRGDTAATSQGWEVTPVFTVGESIDGYLPPGILDGVGAFRISANQAAVLVNHELGEGSGYAYTLANGTELTGARVSLFAIKRRGNGKLQIKYAGPAYDTIYDRFGDVVTDPAQLNEDGHAIDGLARLCSAQAVAEGTYGFEDDIFFTGEESSKPFHPHGGTEWALDVQKQDLWAVPAMGRAAWENVTPLDTGDANTVALLVGDDVEAAPLYLYVGQKGALGDNSFLDRNGLAVGTVYAWRADDGSLSPQDFNGLNAVRTGSFVPLIVKDDAMAGMPGYDAQGYLDGDTLEAQADALGCFSFSRPEDLATNPLDGTQAVFASTGRGSLFPADNWGDTYVIDVDFDDLSCDLVIIHDADDLPVPDAGIRSPDNLDWADDGKIYVQEDRSTSPGNLFGAATGIEASIWQLDPVTRAFTRIAEVDRSAVAPAGATDNSVGDVGNWETSGILDVTDLFGTKAGERLLIATVQAHSVQNGPIGGSALLGEGGQLVFLSKLGE